MNLFSRNKIETDPATLQQLKDWIYELLALDPEIPLSISQLQCQEPGCPPVETSITVMSQPHQQYRVHKAIKDIEKSDLIAALQST